MPGQVGRISEKRSVRKKPTNPMGCKSLKGMKIGMFFLVDEFNRSEGTTSREILL